MIKVLCNKNGKFGYRMKSLSDEIEDDESEPNEIDDAQAVQDVQDKRVIKIYNMEGKEEKLPQTKKDAVTNKKL